MDLLGLLTWKNEVQWFGFSIEREENAARRQKSTRKLDWVNACDVDFVVEQQAIGGRFGLLRSFSMQKQNELLYTVIHFQLASKSI